jgi:flagellar biosynthesis/type III secretory pathway protein FliH
MKRSDIKGSDSLEEAMLKQVEEYGFQKGFKQGFRQGFRQGFKQGFEQVTKKEYQKTIFQLFKNGFDVLQVSKMLTMDEAIIGNLKIDFDKK